MYVTFYVTINQISFYFNYKEIDKNMKHKDFNLYI